MPTSFARAVAGPWSRTATDTASLFRRSPTRMRTILGASILAAGAALAAGLRPAEGASNATGDLANGGTAVGDISKTAAETDTITVNLSAGSRIDVKWTSGFPANVGVSDPSGAPIALGLDATRSQTVSAWLVPASGSYRFTISSSDGSQGTYTLLVKPYWDKKVVVDGTGETTIDVPMPAAGVVKGKVQPLPGASNPSILSLMSPAGAELLLAPVVGSTGLAKLKPVSCDTAGVYHLTAAAAAGTQEFRATLSRKAPRIALAKIDLRNGLDQISYATGGVADYFDKRCASCHSWAGSYAGVRAYINLSLGKMRSGSMPPGGPRADGDTLALMNEWIKTGYGK